MMNTYEVVLITCVKSLEWTLRFLHFFIFAKRGFHIILLGIDGNNVINDFIADLEHQAVHQFARLDQVGAAPTIRSIFIFFCKKPVHGLVGFFVDHAVGQEP